MADTDAMIARGFHRVHAATPGATYSKSGGSILRHWIDVDGDGVKELIVNLGSTADFACLRADGSQVWRSTQNTTQGKPAYFPKITPDGTAFLYGHRANNVLYCINVADGSVRWQLTINDITSIDISSVGVFVGAGDSATTGNHFVRLRSYTDGSVVGGPNWPVAFNQHEQAICVGTLTLGGTPTECVALNDNAGNISVRKVSDASVVFSIASGMGHTDASYYCDIDGDGNNEFITVVDDNDSVTYLGGAEGDEIAVYDETGTLLDSYELPAPFPAIAIREFSTGQGLRIAYALEDDGRVGMLRWNAGALEQVWETSVPSLYVDSGSDSATSQILVGDYDGDGDYEIALNLGEDSGASASSIRNGIVVYDHAGNLIRMLYGHGWDFDPATDKANGDIAATHAADVDGDGKDEMVGSAVGGGNTARSETLDWLNLVDIPAAAQGLEFFYEFEETSGTRADSHGVRGLSATGTGVASRTGKFGNAPDFPAVQTRYLTQASRHFALGNTSWYLSLWLTPDSVASNVGLVSRDAGSSNRRMRLDLNSGAPRLLLFNSSNAVVGSVTAPTTLVAGTAYFVECYHDADADQVGIAVNGEAWTTAATTGTPGGTETGPVFNVGTFEPLVANRTLDGYVDNLGIWSEIPDSTVRAYLYNEGSGNEYPFYVAPDPAPSGNNPAKRLSLSLGIGL